MHTKYQKIGICDIVLMLHELHKRGYQQLRLLSGWSPNGAYIRWNIYPKCVITEGTGGFERNHYGEAPPKACRGSAGAPTYHLNPQEMAEHFITIVPQMCATAKLPDEEYVNWFSVLVEHALIGEYPTAFGEYFPEDKGWIIEPRTQFIPYPPFVENNKIPLLDNWVKHSLTGRSWSYYLDKCTYYKGEVDCPIEVLKKGKELFWKYELMWVNLHFPWNKQIEKSIRKSFKDSIEEYKNLGLSHYRKHDGVCISLKAFLYKQYISNKKNTTIDGFKQWYEEEYYTSGTPSKISKDYLLHLTLFYKGEEECPTYYRDEVQKQLWFSESIVIENFTNGASSKAWGHEFYTWVARHTCKFYEYENYMHALDLYFQNFVEFKMKVLKNI